MAAGQANSYLSPDGTKCLGTSFMPKPQQDSKMASWAQYSRYAPGMPKSAQNIQRRWLCLCFSSSLTPLHPAPPPSRPFITSSPLVRTFMWDVRDSGSNASCSNECLIIYTHWNSFNFLNFFNSNNSFFRRQRETYPIAQWLGNAPERWETQIQSPCSKSDTRGIEPELPMS